MQGWVTCVPGRGGAGPPEREYNLLPLENNPKVRHCLQGARTDKATFTESKTLVYPVVPCCLLLTFMKKMYTIIDLIMLEKFKINSPGAYQIKLSFD